MEGERFLKAHPTDSAFTYLPLKHALSIEDWDSLENCFGCGSGPRVSPAVQIEVRQRSASCSQHHLLRWDVFRPAE